MATGTKLMQEINDQFLHCKICNESFNEPKTLSCLHTFCLSCLQERHDQEATSRSGRYSIYMRHVSCPLCQKKTELPSGGVRRLPDNFLVSNLTDVLAKRTVASSPPCEICSTLKEKTVKASNKCLDCCKLLCTSCVDLHRSTKVTQHHSLIDLQEEKNIQCKVHEEEQVRYYCTPCDACICVVCAFQEHRDHDVCSFNEVSDKHREHLESLLSQCQGRLQEVTSRLNTMHKQETAVKTAKERIRDIAIGYIAQVRAKERELLSQLDELCGGDVQKMSEGKTALQEHKSDLENSCCLTEVMLRERGVELLFVKKEMEAKMNTLLRASLPDLPNEKDLSDVNFVPGEVALGRISLHDEKSDKSNMVNGIDKNSHVSVPTSTPDIINSPSIETKEMCTTMVADMNIKLSHADSQTDLKNTVTRDTCTKLVETVDRGVAATVYNVKARGTMTERSDVRSLKCQTDPGLNNAINNSENGTMISKSASSTSDQLENQPDLISTSPHVYKPGRRIWSRRIQTDISALGAEGLSDLSNDEFLKLMTLSQKKEDDVHAPRRHRRIRTRECGTETDPVEPDTVPKIETTSVCTQSDEPPRILMTSQETSTPTVILEHKGIWTDQTSTCDRASDAIWPRRQDRAVGTVAVRKDNFSQQACPSTSTVNTNTTPTQSATQHTQTEEKQASPKVSPESAIKKPDARNQLTTSQPVPHSKQTENKTKTCDRGSDAIPIPKPSKATETVKIKTSTAGTETTAVKLVDKDVTTQAIKTINQWTETIQPQMVSTGVAPPRPVTQEVGMSTIPVITTEESTSTELKSFRESHTEMIISVCDQETVTDKQVLQDAQTGMEFLTESEGCCTETVDNTEEGSMTDFSALDTTEEDITFYEAKTTLEIAAPPSSKPCAMCGHVANGESSEGTKEKPSKQCKDDDGSSKEAEPKSPLITQDVGTMAMSCTSCKPPLLDMGVQTPHPRLYDKASATSFDWEQDDLLTRPLSREYLDAATSTESLPYIGLLSEIDVDELIVIPEAAFELVSDSESDYGHRDVTMVDGETSTDFVQCVEEGTQTRDPDSSSMTSSGAGTQVMTDSTDSRKGIGEVIKTLVSQNSVDRSGSTTPFAQTNFDKAESGFENESPDKHLVSIGVNTVPKLTFEKETCTPMRHLFSKGTSTFYVSKMDRSTSMLSPKAGLELAKSRSVDKVTMTSQTDRKDIGVETDSAKLDGRITACISKLRNVSERLNSPTSKKAPEGDSFFENSLNVSKPTAVASESANATTQSQSGSALERVKSPVNTPSVAKQELARQRIVKNLLEQSDSGGRVKQTERKPQPITTLKGRRPVQKGQVTTSQEAGDQPTTQTEADETDRTQSLPRRFPGERTGVVKMGSQPLPSSRLPLLRYNSAPGRIATVPNQTLINKCSGNNDNNSVPRPVSPSKIPVTKKKSPPVSRADQNRIDNPSLDEKPKLRNTLPSITETRNSSCSDSSNSSFMSASSATPLATPSNTPEVTPTKKKLDEEGFAPEVFLTPKTTHKARVPSQVDTLSVASNKTSGSSRPPSGTSPTASTSSLDKVSNPDTTRSSSDTIESAGVAGKPEVKEKKKSGMGFMQRLLSKKKKTDSKKDKKNPVCVPVIPASAVVASLANAPPPQPAPHPEEPQQHWPQLQLPPHHYPPPPEPKPPSPPRKPRPFVIVNQRVFSIQQDNVEEVADRVEKRRASMDQNMIPEGALPNKNQLVPGPKIDKKVVSKSPEKSPKPQIKSMKEEKAQAAAADKSKSKKKDVKGK